MTPTGKRITGIPAVRLAQLNSGIAACTTLTECLAVDFAPLMQAVFPTADVSTLTQNAGLGISKRMALAAQVLTNQFGGAIIDTLRTLPSDTLRGWACFAIGQANGPLCEKLTAIRPLADDPHFGVREWAWLALRPHLAADLPASIAQLTDWTADSSPRVRRFASESLRPRGVWCAHIDTLKHAPEMALPILEPLRADPAPYVQDSVANWLNDAAKSQPDWVRSLCARWTRDSNCPETARICKRAQRSISP